MTVDECMSLGAARLRDAGVPEPRRETRLLLAHSLGLDPAAVIGHPERPVPDREAFFALIDRRAQGTPMAHILGKREFWSLDFRVTPDTLDPRPDSEALIEAVLTRLADRRDEPLSVLDLGTGTGCLLLSVLSELPVASGVGVDRSPAAAAVARDNARRLELSDRAHILAGDWTSALTGRFDLILANPPYIPSGDIDGLQVEVAQHEPRLALDGGVDGLDAYRRLSREVPGALAADGMAAFEVGAGQWRDVADGMAAAGLTVEGPVADLSGIDRCVICHCSEGFSQKKGLEAGHEPSNF
ncbi:MAG: peptide chain release factor N(5)-glutamine methyltransferase [Pseudomonadota bacterium]